ncbi:hypothetical protein V7659_01275 [Neobacillus drentensis]|uniref:hypothetical protein n=1 Tax=Neobacillus drentensis TaxID=220684 RepID=UPI003000D626
MSKEAIYHTAVDDLKRMPPVSLKVNGKNMTTKAININTKLLVPLKEVFESCGAMVKINEAEHSSNCSFPRFFIRSGSWSNSSGIL